MCQEVLNGDAPPVAMRWLAAHKLVLMEKESHHQAHLDDRLAVALGQTTGESTLRARPLAVGDAILRETAEVGAEAAAAAAADEGDIWSPFALPGRNPDRGKDAPQQLREPLLRAPLIRPAAAGSGPGGVPGGGKHLPMPPPPTSYVHIHGFGPRASRGPGAAAVLDGIDDVADYDGGDYLAVTGGGRQEATSSWAWMPSPRRWASASMGSSTASATGVCPPRTC